MQTATNQTNRDRVLWPRSGFTKGAMLDYYRSVAEALIPHLAGRPLTMGRWPSGVEQPGFATTDCRGRPGWMRTVSLRTADGRRRRHCVVEDLESLLWVVNLNAVELHLFPAHPGPPREPAFVVFDLDPAHPEAGVDDCAAAALRVRDALAETGLQAVAKTSGGGGVHVFVPLAPGQGFAAAKRFARELAERLAERSRGELTARAGPRRGRAGARVFVDWLQNDARRSIVAPYSLRATPLPSVSTPVGWDEVEAIARGRGQPWFGPDEVVERLGRHGDLFRDALELTQRLER